MEQNQNEQRMISPGLLTTLIVVVLAAAGFFGWNYLQKQKVETPVVIPSIPTKVTKSVIPLTTPTTTSDISTTNWKTYENRDFGFSVKYPLSWPVEVNDNDVSFDKVKAPNLKRSFSVDFMPTWFKNTNAPYSITIDLEKTYKEVIDENTVQGSGKVDAPYWTKTDVVFAGQKAVQISYGYKAADEVKIVIFQNGNNVFTILGYPKMVFEKDGPTVDTFDQISSTFQFIN